MVASERVLSFSLTVRVLRLVTKLDPLSRHRVLSMNHCHESLPPASRQVHRLSDRLPRLMRKPRLLGGLLTFKFPDFVCSVFCATLSFISCASLERCFQKKRESQQPSVTLMQLSEIVSAKKRFVVVSSRDPRHQRSVKLITRSRSFKKWSLHCRRPHSPLPQVGFLSTYSLLSGNISESTAEKTHQT